MVIITKETIPQEISNWGNLQYNLDEHTILHYVDVISWEEDHDNEDVNIPSSFELSATFFGLHYTFLIYQKDISRNCSSVYPDGPSILHSSFSDNMEDNHWGLLCELLNKYVSNENN